VGRFFKNDRIFAFIFIFTFVLRSVLSGYLGLSDDEAYYWDWTQFLDWSYYDHPGMVAWLIKLSTLVLGQNAFSVRLPSLILNSLSLYVLWLLAYEMFGLKIARLTGLLYLLTPIFSLGGLMTVPDIPMGFFWIVATYLIWQIRKRLNNPIEQSVMSHWYLVGLCLGLGFLSKYTMVLLGASLLFYMAIDPVMRGQFRSKNFWGAIIFAILLTFPVWIWNYENNWPSFYFHLVKRQTGGGGASFSRWSQFWISQLAFLTPVIFSLCFITLVKGLKSLFVFSNSSIDKVRWSLINTNQDLPEKWIFIFALSLPTLFVFSIQALFAEFKPHWPAPAYMLPLIGAAFFWFDDFKVLSMGSVKTKKILTLIGGLIFIIPINFLFYIETVFPAVPFVLNKINSASTWEARFDPTNDMYGWNEAAQRAKELKQKIESETGAKIYFATHRYQLNGAFAFALQEQVFCLSPQVDHYDFAQKKQIESFQISPALMVSDNRYALPPATDLGFSACEKLDDLTIYRYQVLAREFAFWLCR
jgi:dolichol-phosphate mannosyltransferase